MLKLQRDHQEDNLTNWYICISDLPPENYLHITLSSGAFAAYESLGVLVVMNRLMHTHAALLLHQHLSSKAEPPNVDYHVYA